MYVLDTYQTKSTKCGQRFDLFCYGRRKSVSKKVKIQINIEPPVIELGRALSKSKVGRKGFAAYAVKAIKEKILVDCPEAYKITSVDWS
jgi:hypothetical protein